jgi:hypothetical protein
MSIYLPNGDGAEVPWDVPEAVPGKDASGNYALVPPGHLALSAQAPSTVHITWNNGSAEFAEHLEWPGSPRLFPIPSSPARPRSVLLRRERGVNDPVVVTASWCP